MRWQEMFLLGGMWTCEAAWGSTASPRLAQAAGVAELLRSTSQPFDIFIKAGGPTPDGEGTISQTSDNAADERDDKRNSPR